MAEAIAAISFASALAALVDFGVKLVKLMNEFKHDVQGLPEAFRHISVQIPLLNNTVQSLLTQAKDGSLTLETEAALRPVVDELNLQLKQLDDVLCKVLQFARGSTWKKGIAAIKTLRAQKTVEDLFSSVIERYVLFLSLYQNTHNVDLTNTLIGLVKQMSLQQLPDIQKPPQRKFMVDYQSDEDFIDREEIMGEIKSRFQVNSRVALAGIGGVGKSRIAIEFYHQYNESDPQSHVFWVHGGSKVRLKARYYEMAARLEIPGIDDPKLDHLRIVSDWLSDKENGSWLMVLDNADNAAIWTSPIQEDGSADSTAPLIGFLPRVSHGFILITTRDSQLGAKLAGVKKQKPIDVLPFGTQEAEILLRSKISASDGLNKADANKLTEALDYLPLAITQAAAFLEEIDTSVAEYLNMLEAGRADTSRLLERDNYDPGRDYESQNSVFLTFKISFEQIRIQNRQAADLLSLMAVLDRQAIPKYLLQDNTTAELPFRQAIQKLKAFSLITKERDASVFTMHRLVQLSTQKWLLLDGAISHWQEAALNAVSKNCPENGLYENWAAWEQILPHVLVVLGFHLNTDPCVLRRTYILRLSADYKLNRGEYESAHRMATESFETREKLLGKDDPDTAISLLTLADIIVAQGKYKAAEELYQRVRVVMESTLGPNHPGTLASLKRVALTQILQGKYTAAVEPLRWVIEKTEDAITLDALETVSILSVLFKKQGRLVEAEEWSRRGLAEAEKLLGPEHVETRAAANYLASILDDAEKHEEAEQLYQQTLDYRKIKLGPGHPDTLFTTNGLALVLLNRSKPEDAKDLCRLVFDGSKRKLGVDHPETIKIMAKLGHAIGECGDYAEAESILLQAFELSRKALGPDDSLIPVLMSLLASTYLSQDRFDKAEAVKFEELELRKRVSGDKYPDTLKTTVYLGYILYRQEKYLEAESLLLPTLELMKTVFGIDHLETFDVMKMIGWILRNQKRWEEAGIIYGQILELRKQLFGEKHPDTLKTMADLGYFLYRQNKYEEAEILLLQTLELMNEVLGMDDIETLKVMENLAWIFEALERVEEAEAMYVQTMKLMKSSLGSDHPETMATTQDFTNFLAKAKGEN